MASTCESGPCHALRYACLPRHAGLSSWSLHETKLCSVVTTEALSLVVLQNLHAKNLLAAVLPQAWHDFESWMQATQSFIRAYQS